MITHDKAELIMASVLVAGSLVTLVFSAWWNHRP